MTPMTPRVIACVNFCAGAPTEALVPGGLMKSFRELLPGGDVFQVLTLAAEHQAVKAENARLKVANAEFYTGVLELATENARLKAGQFTPEEFHNLCHDPESTRGSQPQAFCDGCEAYHKKLFGWSPITKLKERIEMLKHDVAVRDQVNALMKAEIKELHEMVAGRDQNIAERGAENELLRREIMLMRQREIDEGRLKFPQV